MNDTLMPKYNHPEEFKSLEEAKLGQILWAGRNYNKKRITVHPFVVVDNHINDKYIYGAMLTSSKEYNNIPIAKEYFKEKHASGEKYNFPDADKETLFLPRKFVKFQDWAPFYLIGEVSIEGLKIIKDVIGDMEPEIYSWNFNVEAEKIFVKNLNNNDVG